MNVYEITPDGAAKDWFAADSMKECIKGYHKLTGIPYNELMEDYEFSEVPEKNLTELVVYNTDRDASDPEDWEEMSFLEFMTKHMTGPGLVAGTEY